MKLIGDEHVSPKIITEVREKCLPNDPAWSIQSVIGSPYAGIEDEDWIAAFAKDGGQCLISADREMLKRETLIQQISYTGIIGIYFGGAWANSGRLEQLSHLLFWWEKIETKLRSTKPGTAWIVPNNFSKAKDLREVRPHGMSIRRTSDPDT